MAQQTNIEWCDSTVNPTSGCDGCELYDRRHSERAICYARKIHEERLARYQRSGGHYAPSFGEVRMIPGRIAAAARWSDLTGKLREAKPWLDLLPRCIFVGDLADIFSAAVTDEFLEREIFAPMESGPGRRHVWMVLTKRPQRMAEFSRRPGGLPRNVIALCSVTNQATADARIPQLARVQARWRGVSAEPLLGPVSLARIQRGMWHLDWVIVGGASGSNAPPTPVEWIRSLLSECQEAQVPSFLKQLGARSDLRLRDCKGGDMGEWPVGLWVREMPAFELEGGGA